MSSVDELIHQISQLTPDERERLQKQLQKKYKNVAAEMLQARNEKHEQGREKVREGLNSTFRAYGGSKR